MARSYPEVALITGAGSGIGLACARAVLAGGGAVMLLDHAEIGAELAQELDRLPGRYLSRKVDVREVEALNTAVAECLEQFGKLDLVINSAGIIEREAKIEAVAADLFRRVVDINLTGSFLTIQAAAEALRKSRGSVVNIGSMGAFGVASSPAYSASKAGVIGLTRSLAAAFKSDAIRMAAVLPAIVATGMTKDSPKLSAARAAGQSVLEPEDVALIVLRVARRAEAACLIVACQGEKGAPQASVLSESWQPLFETLPA